MRNIDYLRTLEPMQLINYLTCKACGRCDVDDELDKCFASNCEEQQIEWLLKERA